MVNQQVVLGILHRIGLTADVAADGRAALRAFRSRSYDLVLMDEQMPGMDGRTAARGIRLWERRLERTGQGTGGPGPRGGRPRGRVPIVAMTAGRSRLDGDWDEHLPKPVDSRLLVDFLQKWLGLSRNGRSDGIHRTEERIGLPVFDRPDLVDRVMGDESLVEEILQLYLKDAAENVRAMKTALSRMDLADVCRFAHILKGASGSIGAKALAGAARQIETAAGAADYTRTAWLLPLFDDHMHAFRTAIQERRIAHPGDRS